MALTNLSGGSLSSGIMILLRDMTIAPAQTHNKEQYIQRPIWNAIVTVSVSQGGEVTDELTGTHSAAPEYNCHEIVSR